MKFILFCIVIAGFKLELRQQFTNDIKMKFTNFDLLIDHNKIIFLFNNVDNYICKKLGYFVYEAL